MINRRDLALRTLRARLKLEIKFPEFRKSRAGLFTMRSAKGWGFKGSRKQILSQIEKELDD